MHSPCDSTCAFKVLVLGGSPADMTNFAAISESRESSLF